MGIKMKLGKDDNLIGLYSAAGVVKKEFMENLFVRIPVLRDFSSWRKLSRFTLGTLRLVHKAADV